MGADKVNVRCPDCGKKLTLLSRLQHKPISCPACERIFHLAEFEERPNGSTTNGPADPPKSDSASSPVHTVNEQEHIRSYNESRFANSKKFLKVRETQRLKGERNEAMQSIGIFLMIMAMLTTALPFFDLNVGGFAATGLFPIFICAIAAITGTLLLVFSQIDDPVVPIGISAGYLLILIVVWCTVFDFNQFQPNLFAGPNPNAVANNTDPSANNGSQIGTPIQSIDTQDPGDTTPHSEDNPDNANAANAMIVDHKSTRDNLPVGVVPGIDGKAIPKKKWVRGEDLEPVRPRDITIPDDFDPDDDRFAPEGFNSATGTKKNPDPIIKLKDRIKRGLDEDTIDLDMNEKLHVRKSVEIRKITRKLIQHRIYRDKIDNDEFTMKYELSPVMGRKAVGGKVYLQSKPVVGVDVLSAIHGGGIDLIVPIHVGAAKLETSQVAPADRRLGGLDLAFNDDLIVGVRGLFSKYSGNRIASEQYMYAKWLGYEPREGREKQILSDGRTIHGFALFESERGVVGVALVYLRN